MKSFPWALGLVLVLTVAGSAGCVKRQLSDSEFRGFCYTLMEGRFASCDTINMCNDFDSNVLSVKHPSAEACSQACQAEYNRQYGGVWVEGCSHTLLSATNWCIKWCATNYPQ